MKKSLAALAAAGIATASLLTAAPSASAGGSCGTTGILTDQLRPGTSGYKTDSWCHDLNLTYADDKSGSHDAYAGFYRDAYGYWTRGSAGYIEVNDGVYGLDQVVLVSNLTSGREFSVASKYSGGDYVEITH